MYASFIIIIFNQLLNIQCIPKVAEYRIKSKIFSVDEYIYGIDKGYYTEYINFSSLDNRKMHEYADKKNLFVINILKFLGVLNLEENISFKKYCYSIKEKLFLLLVNNVPVLVRDPDSKNYHFLIVGLKEHETFIKLNKTILNRKIQFYDKNRLILFTFGGRKKKKEFNFTNLKDCRSLNIFSDPTQHEESLLRNNFLGNISERIEMMSQTITLLNQIINMHSRILAGSDAHNLINS